MWANDNQEPRREGLHRTEFGRNGFYPTYFVQQAASTNVTAVMTFNPNGQDFVVEQDLTTFGPNTTVNVTNIVTGGIFEVVFVFNLTAFDCHRQMQEHIVFGSLNPLSSTQKGMKLMPPYEQTLGWLYGNVQFEN